MKPPKPTEPDMPNEVEELSIPIKAAAGIKDDDDDRDDERADENEIPVRETDDATEAPDEFKLDDKDEVAFGEEDRLEDEAMEEDELEEEELEEDELEDEEADREGADEEDIE